MSASGSERVLKNKLGADTVHGHHTDIVVTEFENKVLVVLSQYEKLGTLVLVNKDVALEETAGSSTYTTKVLLGKDDDVINVIARNLAEEISTAKPVLFTLALKDTLPQTVRELSPLVQQYWTSLKT